MLIDQLKFKCFLLFTISNDEESASRSLRIRLKTALYWSKGATSVRNGWLHCSNSRWRRFKSCCSLSIRDCISCLNFCRRKKNWILLLMLEMSRRKKILITFCCISFRLIFASTVFIAEALSIVELIISTRMSFSSFFMFCWYVSRSWRRRFTSSSLVCTVASNCNWMSTRIKMIVSRFHGLQSTLKGLQGKSFSFWENASTIFFRKQKRKILFNPADDCCSQKEKI